MSSIKQWVLKAAVFFWIVLSPIFLFAKSDKINNSLLPHAQTYYWLGIQDKGDPGAFRMALMFLEQAKEELHLSNHSIDEKEINDSAPQDQKKEE